MTFDDDFMRIHFESTYKDLPCKANGFEWPPPETIEFCGFSYRLTNYSSITDMQRSKMTHVMRGSEYHFEAQSENRK